MSLAEEARTVRERIASRLRELEPLVREYHELKKLAAEMGLQAPPPPSKGASTEAPRASTGGSGGRRRAPKGKRSASPSATGPASQPVTAAQEEVAKRVLEAVRSSPGKTVAEYGEILGLAPTALYRPVRELTNDGALVKRARQLFPT